MALFRSPRDLLQSSEEGPELHVVARNTHSFSAVECGDLLPQHLDLLAQPQHQGVVLEHIIGI